MHGDDKQGMIYQQCKFHDPRGRHYNKIIGRELTSHTEKHHNAKCCKSSG